VFLPREFADLGGEDQVLRVLRGMVREGRLVRLGYGVYGRAVISQLSGEPILYSPNGFAGAARQALNKLGGVGADPGRARLQRRPVDAGAGQSCRTGEGALLAAAPLRKYGACA
jgi:hypothetical protein